MPVYRPVALFHIASVCLFALTAVPARAQTSGPQSDAVKASVIQVLSLATFGTISTQDLQAAVTQDGSNFRVRLPLSGVVAPPDAAVTAIARPLDDGRVGIESMTFPSSGTIETTPASGSTNRIAFNVGTQSVRGTVDPTLATESTYTAAFSDIRLETAQAEIHGEQTIEHATTNGTFSAGPDGRLTLASQSRASGIHMVGHGATGFQSDTSARAMAGNFSVEGLDRAQATRMLAAFRSLTATGAQARQAQVRPGQTPTGQTPTGQTPTGQNPAGQVSAEQRRQLAAIVEAARGLLNRVELDETMEDVHFAVATPRGGGAGTIGSVRLTMAGDAMQDRLNTSLGMVVERIAVPAMAPETAGLVPHHVELKTVLAGVPVAGMMALLRAATQEQPDPDLLQAQATTLLSDPRARIGIDILSFDSGPLSVTGSAKLLPAATGEFTGDIHIAARGVDALLAQIQGQPKLQQVLPMIFLAKGMARAQGDSLVWDIVLGDGPPTINGTPFGQPSGSTR